MTTTARRPAATRTQRNGARPDAAATPFARRREALATALTRDAGKDGGPVAALFASGREARRNGDVDYEFRQPSTFYYLTGFEEPDAVALLRPGHKEPYVLFVRPHDPQMAIWVGPRAGVEGSRKRYGAAVAYPIEELVEPLPKLLAGIRPGYFSLDS